MAKRTHPNDYFAWYNDDNRLAVIVQDSGGSYCTLSQYGNKTDCEDNDGTWVVAGNITSEKYDTYKDSDVSHGIRVYYNSKYINVDELTDDLYSDAGVDSGLQVCILYYIKARLYEDAGDMEKSQYFRKLFYRELKQYPTRRSGTRRLAVPHL